jgi:hypothetical protein
MIEYWSGFANDYAFPKCVRKVRLLFKDRKKKLGIRVNARCFL